MKNVFSVPLELRTKCKVNQNTLQTLYNPLPKRSRIDLFLSMMSSGQVRIVQDQKQHEKCIFRSIYMKFGVWLDIMIRAYCRRFNINRERLSRRALHNKWLYILPVVVTERFPHLVVRSWFFSHVQTGLQRNRQTTNGFIENGCPLRYMISKIALHLGLLTYFGEYVPKRGSIYDKSVSSLPINYYKLIK